MTEEEFQALQNEQFAKVSPAKTPALKSAGRGALSGLLGGLQPQAAGILEALIPGGQTYSEGVKEAQYLNEKAMRDNPLTYGAGYGAGTGAGMLAGPGLASAAGRGFGAVASKIAPEALTAAGLGMGNIPTTAQAAVQAVKNVLPTMPSLPKAVAKTVNNPIAQQAAVRGITAVSNTPAFSDVQNYLSEQQKMREAMQKQGTIAGRAETNTDSK